MKTAHGKYHFAHNEILLDLYFDPKCLSCILPPLDSKEQDHFFRQVCDSIAIAMPKDVSEKHFYIKRVFKEPQADQLILFCTDGFLVDFTLHIPLYEQPFQMERIKITDIEQLPSRFKLTNQILKTMQSNLTAFEEQAKKIFSSLATTPDKTNKQSAEVLPTVSSFAKTKDAYAEINVLKKEIQEMAKSRQETLKNLMKDVDEKRKTIYDLIMQETLTGLSYQENKKKLQEYGEKMINQYCNDFIQETASLKEKINYIIPMPEQFDRETQEAIRSIAESTNHFNQFKEYLLKALYDAAQEYAQICQVQLAQQNTHQKQIAIQEFNRKFAPIATLSDQAQLSSYPEMASRLLMLSLDELQTIVSNDNKDQLGMLQKCNTSWVEESKELQILLKHLNQLNMRYRNFFNEQSLFAPFANMNMTEIIRIPFPRGFQFKFSTHAKKYQQELEEFCKTQKEKVAQIAKSYKKIMQIEDTLHKTKKSMQEAERSSRNIHLLVTDYKHLLQRKEESGELIKSAQKEYDHIEKIVIDIQQLLHSLEPAFIHHFKSILKKLTALVDDAKDHALAAQKDIQFMTKIKIQIDSLLKNEEMNSQLQDKMKQLDEQTTTLRIRSTRLQETTKNLDSLLTTLLSYQQLIELQQKIQAFHPDTIRRQHQKAKSLVSQVIRQQSSQYSTLSEQRKKQMVELFSQIDQNVNQVEKQYNKILLEKNELFDELSEKNATLSSEMMIIKVAELNNDVNVMSHMASQVNDCLEQIKKMIG